MRTQKHIELKRFLKQYNEIDIQIKTLEIELNDISINTSFSEYEKVNTNSKTSITEKQFEKREVLRSMIQNLKSNRNKINIFLECLTDKEKMIFNSLIGKVSTSNLSRSLGVTEQYACLLKNKLLDKIDKYCFLHLPL